MPATRRHFLKGAGAIAGLGFIPAAFASASAGSRVALLEREDGESSGLLFTIGAGVGTWTTLELAPGPTNLLYTVEADFVANCLADPFTGRRADVLGKMCGNELPETASVDQFVGATTARLALVVRDSEMDDIAGAAAALCRRAGKSVITLTLSRSSAPEADSDLAFEVLSTDWDDRDSPHLNRSANLADCIGFLHSFAEGGGIVGVDFGDLRDALSGMTRAVFCSTRLAATAPESWGQAAENILQRLQPHMASMHGSVIALHSAEPHLEQWEAVLDVVRPRVWDANVTSGLWPINAWPAKPAPTLSVLALSRTV